MTIPPLLAQIIYNKMYNILAQYFRCYIEGLNLYFLDIYSTIIYQQYIIVYLTYKSEIPT